MERVWPASRALARVIAARRDRCASPSRCTNVPVAGSVSVRPAVSAIRVVWRETCMAMSMVLATRENAALPPRDQELRCRRCKVEFGIRELAGMRTSARDRCLIDCPACGACNVIRVEQQTGLGAPPHARID